MSHNEPTQTNEDERDVQVPDPEVVPQAKRRQFTAEYKLRILGEADACTEPGQIGSLLRREGLYSSYLSKWRQQREEGTTTSPALPGNEVAKPKTPSAAELARTPA